MKNESDIETEVAEQVADTEQSAYPFSKLFVQESAHEGPGKMLSAHEGLRAPGLSQAAAAWHHRLPQFTREEAELSSSINLLPHPFYSQAARAFERTLAQYGRLPEDEVRLTLEDWWEDDIQATAFWLQGQHLFASFLVGPTLAHAALEIRTGFAAALIDRILGGDGLPPDTLRNLSDMECAVIEFLYLEAARRLNAQLGGAALQLESVTSTLPLWLTSLKASASAGDPGRASGPRGLLAMLRVDFGQTSGYMRVYSTAGLFKALAAARHEREAQQDRFSGGSPTWAAQRFERYARVAPEIDLTLLIGETELIVSELKLLEVGDVFIIEKTVVFSSNGAFHGDLRVRVGEGDALIIKGSALSPNPSAAETMKLTVGTVVLSDQPTETEEGRMEEAAGNNLFGGDATALGGLLLTVHVEMALRRVTLDELAALRVGQILDLGRRATDPVDLVVDGRRIARGELIEIEGRIGVRLTQVASQ
jgi:type III secretion system YscQ/HrcQ family protein